MYIINLSLKVINKIIQLYINRTKIIQHVQNYNNSNKICIYALNYVYLYQKFTNIKYEKIKMIFLKDEKSINIIKNFK